MTPMCSQGTTTLGKEGECEKCKTHASSKEYSNVKGGEKLGHVAVEV